MALSKRSYKNVMLKNLKRNYRNTKAQRTMAAAVMNVVTPKATIAMTATIDFSRRITCCRHSLTISRMRETLPAKTILDCNKIIDD